MGYESCTPSTNKDICKETRPRSPWRRRGGGVSLTAVHLVSENDQQGHTAAIVVDDDEEIADIESRPTTEIVDDVLVLRQLTEVRAVADEEMSREDKTNTDLKITIAHQLERDCHGYCSR